jgi:hypothetical protein
MYQHCRYIVLLVLVTIIIWNGGALYADGDQPAPRYPRVPLGDGPTCILPAKYQQRAGLPKLPQTVQIYKVKTLQAKNAFLVKLLKALPIEATPQNKAKLAEISRRPEPGQWEVLTESVGGWEVMVFPSGQFEARKINTTDKSDNKQKPQDALDEHMVSWMTDALVARLQPVLPHAVSFAGIKEMPQQAGGAKHMEVYYHALIRSLPVMGQLSVEVAPGPIVVRVQSDFRHIVPDRIVPIMSPTKAFQKIQEGEGTCATNIDHQPISPYTGYLDYVRLAYWEDAQNIDLSYLLPIYVLGGEAVAQGGLSARWSARIDALSPEFLEPKGTPRKPRWGD